MPGVRSHALTHAPFSFWWCFFTHSWLFSYMAPSRLRETSITSYLSKCSLVVMSLASLTMWMRASGTRSVSRKTPFHWVSRPLGAETSTCIRVPPLRMWRVATASMNEKVLPVPGSWQTTTRLQSSAATRLASSRWCVYGQFRFPFLSPSLRARVRITPGTLPVTPVIASTNCCVALLSSSISCLVSFLYRLRRGLGSGTRSRFNESAGSIGTVGARGVW